MISIIIPYFGRWDLTHARLAELYKFAPDDAEIILVNDASEEIDCETGVTFWQNAHKNKIRYKRNEENVGFGKSCNTGAKLAKGDIIIFLSNDVIVSGDVFTPIVEKITETPDSVVGGEVIYWDSGWNTLTIDGKKTIVPYPMGWLIACRKEIWEKIGGFDPRYGKFDYEDVDVGATANYLGLTLISLKSHNLKHLSGVTIYGLYPDREAYTKRNQKLFQEKWEQLYGRKSGNSDGIK